MIVEYIKNERTNCILVKKLLLDPVIISQKQNKVSFSGSKILLSHKLSTPSRNLYQVMVLDFCHVT